MTRVSIGFEKRNATSLDE